MISDSDQGESQTTTSARPSKRRSRSSGVNKTGCGRESPIGAEREREFPTTKIGVSGTPDKGMGGSDSGSNHDRQFNYHNHGVHGRCSGSHGMVQTPAVGRSVITGDLVQSRDFHYSVEPAPVYRRPREVVAYHSPAQAGHISSSRSRAESRADYAYVDHKSSPYHSGTLRTSVRGLPDDGIQRVRPVPDDSLHVRGQEDGLRTGRLDQNYMMVRAQSRLQDGYDRLSHRSDSRNDLLDNDHTIYDHGLYYQPGQYTGFVRTCDGKFIRTNIPQHDFETLDTNFYRNTAMHTLRRPSKNRHQNSDYCCPSRDTAPANLRASDQLQQSYATLRGRKYTDKNGGRGVGDNYGRNTMAPNYMDDARSVHSLADDFFLPTNGRGGHPQHTKSISRSTDKSLDSLGLDEENERIPGFPGLASLANIRSDDILATMLKREPPDGKEKPEPPKHQKLETLSRKNSKCDLLDTRAVTEREAVCTASTSTSGCGDSASVLSGSTGSGTGTQPHTTLSKTDSSSSKRDSITANAVKDTNNGYLDSSNIINEEDLVSERLKDWKVPSSPRCPSVSSVSMVPTAHSQLVASASIVPCSSPKPVGTPGLPRGRQPSLTSQMAARALNTSQYSEPCTSLSPLCHDQPSMPVQVKTYFTRKITRFFGVDSSNEDQAKTTWVERRRRMAIKKLGGVKEEEYLSGFGVENSSYGSYGESYGARSRTAEPHPTSLTSELEGDKMVLKIAKPPRDKDSIVSLSWQCCSWMVSSFKHKAEQHPLEGDHLQSRSYLPSAAGQAAYYQAETCGGLAVCQPLTRISNHHHFSGESPAEEVFFNKPTSQPESSMTSIQKQYTQDPYRFICSLSTADYYYQYPYYYCNCRSCSWQLPKTENEVPRMSSDVGVSRIWNRMLDAAFDNSNRRKHGMGLLGKVMRKRRLTRRMPESSRKRKLGGNSKDHRPYFTYWVTFVQVAILFISLLLYGFGPIGVDLYKRSSMVLVTSLSLENIGYLEPANFWIGPAALDLVHLGAKYGPCMRWDETIDRQIQDDRNKERDTACCLREDQAGCVQTQKSECKGAEGHNPPRTETLGGKHSWRIAGGNKNPWDYRSWSEHHSHHGKWLQYPEIRSSGPVCGLDPAFCEAPASVAPYVWPDDITKWPICRKRKEHADTPPSEAEHMVCEVIGHPCCIGIRGQCQITTKEFCDFVKGVFHEEAALCSQVSCMNDVCGLLPFRQRDVPDQFYRIWTSLFLHAGIFHLLITVAFQYWLMRDLEKMAGAKRIAIIYLGSGMVGNLASAIFVPYRAEVGPAGAHFGLLACCIVEVIHQWPTLKYPEMAILKLVGVTAVFFLSGLLPWIDNYAHLFGFIFGFLISYAIMPFVTFGIYDRRRKLILLWICLLSSIFIFVGLILLFYVTPIHDCEICKYFNCIPITKDFCSEQNIDLREAV